MQISLKSCALVLLLSAASLAVWAEAPAQLTDPVALAPVAEIQKTTSHQTTISGRVIRYQATAGTLTIRSDDGKPAASMFYVAYVATRADKAAPPRPLTFFFNGGPGSASLWLNVGGFGPLHAPTASPKPTGLPPYEFGPADSSLLDKTDMVFLDAIGTGYSRTLLDTRESQFWGVDADVNAFARAITRYVTINRRGNSPKFLFGESYGTTRAAALVYKLQTQGMDFNGVVLLSTILNFGSQQPGLDEQYIHLLPSYAATAWYHGRVAHEPADFAAFLQGVREYAQGPYAAALAKGHGIPPAEEQEVARRLHDIIGLSADYLKQSRLRIDMEAFRKALLEERGQVIGRFDSRFTAPAAATPGGGAMDPATNDPATRGVGSAYLSTYRDYLSGELGYSSDLDYRALYNMVIEPAWDMHHKAPGLDEPLTTPNTALDLAAAMRGNPQLQVYCLNGLYDLATPFFATEFDVSHMLLSAELRKNVQFAYYETGHMAYGDQAALRSMKSDLSRFYDLAAPLPTKRW